MEDVLLTRIRLTVIGPPDSTAKSEPMPQGGSTILPETRDMRALVRSRAIYLVKIAYGPSISHCPLNLHFYQRSGIFCILQDIDFALVTPYIREKSNINYTECKSQYFAEE